MASGTPWEANKENYAIPRNSFFSIDNQVPITEEIKYIEII